ncbi:F-box/FBD/LRR-repeat-like protein [Cinnamomum micranthum f. kanehirae]|uniref:F-box/FBD/LRR-repeat-like protein n=1 Tax=Cinnamomum micranthum f. kanehirae TaxID=337451 RepID=A0A3S3NET2_9MAGN|nr:F-box/FBD/LRR-repeat-like protein [Cinnamomum micranthum f. kanehirae]
MSEEYRSDELRISLHNLQEVQLVMPSLFDEYLSYIYGFLKNCVCPCLEKLFIYLPSAPEIPYEYDYYMKPPLVEEPSERAFNHFKVIKISGFKGHCDETRLLKTLLEKAIISEKVVLVLSPTLEKDSRTRTESTQMPSNLHEELLLLPKAASVAQIVLCAYSEDYDSLCPTQTNVYCKL